MAYTYPTWFFSPVEGQLVKVDSASAVPYDPHTDEQFADLNVEFMRESDDWFEYTSEQDALG